MAKPYLTPAQDSLIQQDLKILLPDYDKLLEDVLEKFMNASPETTKIFIWADESQSGTEQKAHPRFKHHARAVGKTLLACLTNLNAIKVNEGHLKALGSLHNNRKVPYQLYEKFGESILENVAKRLGEKWNEERKEAWTKAYEVVTYYMIVRYWENNW